MERRIAIILAGLLYLWAAVSIVDAKLFEGQILSGGLLVRVR